MSCYRTCTLARSRKRTSSTQSKNSTVVLSQTMIPVFLLLVIPFSNAFSFNYTSFSRDDTNISYERAYAENQVITLTRNNLPNFGRATYNLPMHLWDEASGNLTDFSTYFSFIIDSNNRTTYGDGIAFFLVPNGTKMPDNVTKGGALGLTYDDQMPNSTSIHFVAMEFDIYKNSWDPPGAHVGVDINSLVSVNNVSWAGDIRDGKTNEAWITYNSSTKSLSVVFTGYQNDTIIRQSLSYVVDLRSWLPEWVDFGFSASTGNQSAAHTILAWNFTSSLDASVDAGVGQTRKGTKTGLIVGLSTAIGCILVIGLVVILFFVWRKRNRDKEVEDAFNQYMGEEFQMGSGPKKFSYSELANATGNFKSEQKLGEGGFGGVYRGFLKTMNIYVAVKRVSNTSSQGMKEYASEVKIISRLRHRNLVQLIGWCHQRMELLLVYEFMPNGSLDLHLLKGRSLLPWAARYKIAHNLASALLYLQEEWEQCVVHRDIKSSNIMLDSDFNAKLGDFGLARLVDHEKDGQTTALAGTMGYMAPECAITYKATKESDIYSFGIVCLEIACGRKPVDPRAKEDQVILVEWVWDLYGRGEMFHAADPRLYGDFDDEQMERLMVVGLWCAHPDSRRRPSAKQVIHVLEFENPLPRLPTEYPVATYSTPSFTTFSRSSWTNESQSFTNNTDSSQLTSSTQGSSTMALL